jgi:hypothetical protein
MKALKITGTFNIMGGTIIDPIGVIRNIAMRVVQLPDQTMARSLVAELSYHPLTTEPSVEIDKAALPHLVGLPELWTSEQAVVGSTWSEAVHTLLAERITSDYNVQVEVIDVA